VKQETLTLLEKSSAALTVGTGAATSATKTFGWLEYLDIHAGGIGVVLTIFFGIGYLIFHYLSLKKQTLANEYKVKLDRLSGAFEEHKAHVSKGITSILDKLDKQG
jgi:hypothetical protein